MGVSQRISLRDKMVEVYETMYGQKPEVVAIHAGLECGLFIKKSMALTVYLSDRI